MSAIPFQNTVMRPKKKEDVYTIHRDNLVKRNHIYFVINTSYQIRGAIWSTTASLPSLALLLTHRQTLACRTLVVCIDLVPPWPIPNTTVPQPMLRLRRRYVVNAAIHLARLSLLIKDSLRNVAGWLKLVNGGPHHIIV
jgi:hypothetical protein